ncbi:MAG: hypothetical protein KBD29_00185 [Candidatus Magasanikbacteria bacterium]|nr:hypothetical protein [Candidatus Magasanikbacteria bacterium]
MENVERISESQYTSEMYSQMKDYFQKRGMEGGVLSQPTQRKEKHLGFDLLLHGNWKVFGLQIKAPLDRDDDVVFEIDQVQLWTIRQKNKYGEWLFYCFPTFQKDFDMLSVVRDHLIIMKHEFLLDSKRVSISELMRDPAMSWGQFIEKLFNSRDDYGFKLDRKNFKSVTELVNSLAKKLKDESPDLLMFIDFENNKYLILPKEQVNVLSKELSISEKLKVGFENAIKSIKNTFDADRGIIEGYELGGGAAAMLAADCTFKISDETPVDFEKDKEGRIILMRFEASAYDKGGILKKVKFHKFGNISSELVEEIGIKSDPQAKDGDIFFTTLDNTIKIYPNKKNIFEVYCRLKKEASGSTMGVEIQEFENIELVGNESMAGFFPIKGNLIEIK